ncbi:MAG: hypothetical protein IJH65_03870 [Methanobrevibacter sp.]|nr:hypothetical protein [Methanobrevibacter sp.]
MGQSEIEKNKLLVERYPFLAPRNENTGEIDENYDYSFTELDALEDGWRIRFGIPLLEDLRELLVELGCLDDYRIIQIKEKYGQLRWYDNSPDEWSDHMDAWSYISEHTCKNCGAFPVPMRDDGWISPWCDDCFGFYRGKTYNDEEREKYTFKEFGTDRILEFLEVTEYYDGEYKTHYIDMKPYYKKIGYTDFDNLITKEEMEDYKLYKETLDKWTKISKEMNDPTIIPYEVQEMNPFKDR